MKRRILFVAFITAITLFSCTATDSGTTTDSSNLNDRNSCNNDFNAISQEINKAAAKYNDCQTNEECKIAYIDIKCLSTCPMAINTDKMKYFEEELEKISDSYCIDDCKASANCEIREPECQNNKCVMVIKNPGT